MEVRQGGQALAENCQLLGRRELILYFLLQRVIKNMFETQLRPQLLLHIKNANNMILVNC